MSVSGGQLQVDHVGIVVRDLDDAKATIEALFGLKVAEELDARDVLGVKTVFYHLGNISIELLEPSDEEGRVDDIDSAAAELSARGAAWATPEAVAVGDRMVRFSRPDSTGGVVYQLLEQR
jgi:methylmalonyl-CoA/ethylmalonyl-CoA epimerase